MNSSVGTVKANKLKTVPPKAPLMKSLLNTLPSMENTTLRRPLLTLPPVKLERQVKLPTASEERAPNTSTKLLDNPSQSHSLEDNWPTAIAKTMLDQLGNIDLNAYAEIIT